jgi:hypothetical protein
MQERDKTMKWYDKNLILIFLFFLPIWILGLIVFDVFLFPRLKLLFPLNIILGFGYGAISTLIFIKVYDKCKYHMPDYHEQKG